MTNELRPKERVGQAEAEASERVLFRREAIEAHAAGHQSTGSPLRISPRWIRWVYPLLVLVLLSLLLFTTFGSVREYAKGRGIVRVEGEEQVSKVTLLMIFPGHVRPLLETGMPLWLELDGFAGSPLASHLGEVKDGILGPNDVREILGAELADTLTLSGPLAVAFAPLPGDGFEEGDRMLAYHHGLQGQVEVRLGSERILPTLLPALKPFFDRDER